MKKISKIMGVGLALIMVFSLAFALVPAKAQADEGNMQWVAQPIPTAAYNVLAVGSNIVEFAIANDGVTIYAINNATAAGAALNMNAAVPAGGNFQVYKSVDAGQTWVGIATTAIAGATNDPLANVAVSPTSADVVAISSFDAAGGNQDLVYVSNSGGIAWSPLPAPASVATPVDCRIMDLKIGPDRADAILQREYLIAVADSNAVPSVTEGGLQIIGAAEAWAGATGTAWADITDLLSAAPPAGDADFMACEFSPQYLGQRTVVGVGAAPAAAGISLQGTSVFVFNTQADTLLNAVGTGDLLNANSREFVSAAAVNDALSADIALSPDFDFATPGYDKVYASITYGAAGAETGGVYRTEQGLPVANILVGQAIDSISYAGDSWGGTLFAADYNALPAPQVMTRVRYTTQPVINAPTWYPSRKSPTGDGGFGYVRVSPTFLTDQTVYAGTTSAVAQESAFSVSTDAGVSFNQESLIDLDASNTVVAINSFALTPDGETIYLLTDDDDAAGGVVDQFSLWKSVTGPSPFSWVRVGCWTHAQNVATIVARMAINRAEWADNPEIYVAESPSVALTFYVSSDGGNLWANRSAPVIPGAAIAMIWAEKQQVAYVGIGANVFKTVSGGAGAWGPPVPTFVPAIVSVVALPGSDGNSHVLVGGTTGAASLSIDGGTSFALLPPGLAAAGSYIVIPDGEYPVAGAEGENLLYAGDINPAGNFSGLYRLKVGVDTLWESMANPTLATEPLAGLGMSNGTLYGMTQGAADNTPVPDATAEAECDRTLVPHFAVGDMVWGTMDVPVNSPVAIGIGLFDVAQNKLYAADNTPGALVLWAYNDYYATSNTVINTPAAGATIPIDPVTGRANLLAVTWDAVGTGTGLGTNYMFAIFEASQGFPGAVIVPCGAMPLPSAPSNAIYPWAVPANPPDINYTFVGGTSYGVMIAALNQVSGDVIMSQWSDPLIFDVEASGGIIQPPHAGPLLNEPTLDATSTGVDVGLSWAPMSGVTEYMLVISTNSDLSAPIISEMLGTTSYGTTLDFDVVYYYGVNASAPTSSVQTTGTFTMAEPVEKYTCEYCGLTFDTREELEAHIAAAHAPTTPLYIWIVIVIGAILVIAVIWLIFTTRRT